MSSNDFRQAQRDLTKHLHTVEGCESLLGDAYGKVKEAGATISKSVANKAVDVTASALKRANTELIKLLGTRRLFISHLFSKAKKDERAQIEVTFPKTLLAKTTRDGNPDDLIPSVDVLIRNVESILKYGKDLEAYYAKELEILKGITKIKTTEDAARLVNRLDELQYPTMKLKEQVNSMSQSEWLPGGYAFGFNHDTGLLTIVDDNEFSTTEVEDTLTVADVKTLLTKLNTLTSLYQDASKLSDSYVNHLKTFNTVVVKSFQHLDSLKGEISTSLLNDLKDRLNGDQLVFSFFVGSLPKVMVRLDDYVDTLSSYLSKQFN